ncbi:hypothetical protein OFM04_37260, partial [Escherichia coli]|nr:hypothetical protein [Escherichia coli]
MESNSERERIAESEFFLESGRLSIAPAGSRDGDGFRDIWANTGLNKAVIRQKNNAVGINKDLTLRITPAVL